MKKRPMMILATVAFAGVLGAGLAGGAADAATGSLSSNGSLAIDMFTSVLGTFAETLLSNGS